MKNQKKLNAVLDADFKALNQELQGKETSRFKVVNYRVPDPREVRKKTGLSQSGFAQAMGVGVRAVQCWEQNLRRPEGVTVKVLRLLEQNPNFIRRLQKA